MKSTARYWEAKDGQVLKPDHFFFLFVSFLFVIGCSTEISIQEMCGEKLSAPLQNAISQVHTDTDRISIVITLADSAGISESFPMLSIPNTRIALGHLMKEEISALCKHKNVLYIDTPKTRFPNN